MKALIWPILEYGAGLWFFFCTRELLRKIEHVQTHFLRGLLGVHFAQNEFLRMDTGTMSMESRLLSAVAMTWGRLIHSRNPVVVTILRERHSMALFGPRVSGWADAARSSLDKLDLGQFWLTCTAADSLPDWRRRVRAAARLWEANRRTVCLAALPSLLPYTGVLLKTTSRFESYLDVREVPLGFSLKKAARCDRLPLFNMLARLNKWPAPYARCALCDSGEDETAFHMIAVCPRWAEQRQ
jgi:hypothetical protein